MVASTVRSPSFIIDFGASRHMVSTRDSLLSHDDSKGPNIFLGDNLETESKGKGSIDFDHGSFNNVLYFPGVVANRWCSLSSQRFCSDSEIVSGKLRLSSVMSWPANSLNHRCLLVHVFDVVMDMHHA